MLTTNSTTDLRQRLQVVESYLARITEHLHRVEGERDLLVRQLSDHEGCDDRRFAIR